MSRLYKRYTPQEKAYIKKHYADTHNKEIAKALGRTIESVRYQAKQMKLLKSDDFKKIMNKETQFAAGHLPHNTKADGMITIRYDKKNTPHYWIRLKLSKWEYLQRHVWRKHHGEIPKGMMIAFKDGNTLNCHIDNLEMITREENMRRNSAVINLPDTYVANLICGKFDKHLRPDVEANKTLINIKRSAIRLNRAIKKKELNQNS